MHSDCIRSYRKRQKGNLFLLHVRCRRVFFPDVISSLFPHLIWLSSSSFPLSTPHFYSHFLNLLNVFRRFSLSPSLLFWHLYVIREGSLFSDLSMCVLWMSPNTLLSYSVLSLPGFSSHVVLEGSKAILRCNTSAWSEDATVIIWFRGLSGSAIYSYDRRTSLEKMHVKGESSPPPPPVPQLPSSSLSSSSSSSFSGEAHDHKRLDERPEDHVFPDRERLFVDRSSPIPSLVIDPVKETDGGDYRWVQRSCFLWYAFGFRDLARRRFAIKCDQMRSNAWCTCYTGLHYIHTNWLISFLSFVSFSGLSDVVSMPDHPELKVTSLHSMWSVCEDSFPVCSLCLALFFCLTHHLQLVSFFFEWSFDRIACNAFPVVIAVAFIWIPFIFPRLPPRSSMSSSSFLTFLCISFLLFSWLSCSSTKGIVSRGSKWPSSRQSRWSVWWRIGPDYFLSGIR